MQKLIIEVKIMGNEKLREIKLSKASKYTILTAFLLTVIGGGLLTMSKTEEANESEIVNSDNVNVPEEKEEEIVVTQEEKLITPYKVNAQIKTYYYDINDNSATREKALIYYNGSYTPSKGIDYFYNNNNFEVIASFSGKVMDKKVDPLYGVSVYIKNDNGLVAIYSSLSDVNIKVGDNIKQGDVIAKAGSNTISSSLGNHLNFSLMKNDKYINPMSNFSKNIKDI